jgi:CheY-specific phosphatase CheX
MLDQHSVRTVMDAVFARTRAFLQDETGVALIRTTSRWGELEAVALHDVTAIAGVGGGLNLLIAFSFSTGLLERLFMRVTDGLDIPADEHDIYVRDTASEVVNIILGRCTADLADSDRAISLSPPVLIEEAKSIRRVRNALFASLCLETEHGAVDINFVGPRELFDPALNYTGGEG